MADVDLVVAVTDTGVQRTIANIENLRSRGLLATDMFRRLATQSQRALDTIARESSRGATSFTGFDKAVRETGQGASSLTAQLQHLEQEYRDIAATAPKATAAMRLTMAGGGGLMAGMNRAMQIQGLREMLSADPVRDMMTVQREQMALADARSRALAAQGVLATAVWERELAGMTPVAAAQARLARSTQELAVATRLMNLANDRLAATGGAITANFDRQAAAALRLAQAQRGLIASRQELQGAQSADLANERRAASGSQNAFLSSFSYFIIAGLATQAAASIRDMGGAAITASAEISRSFADVRRTTEGTDQQLISLRGHLAELATTTPNSFVDLAQIATLGNQLGVAAKDVEGFTTTMAQYTAVSGQSAEDAATAFGRISNLTGLAATEYGNLASAITYVARTSVATEGTIQNTAKEITALASGAGFSADSIVGLAGALSSLAIPPERARGALSLYFGALNSAVAEGGPKMEAFSEITNKSAADLEKMVRENRGQEVFTAFIQGLSQLDTVAKSSALDELGLSTIRVDQTMRALSQNVPLLTSSFEGANRAFRENTEIGNQYAIIQRELTSQWTMFQSAVQLAAGAVGDSFAPAARDLLATLNHLLVGLTAFASTPFGKAMVQLISLAAALTAGIAAIVGVAALAKASLVILAFAIEGFGWTAATAGLRGWVASLAGVAPAAGVAGRSTVGFRVALAETTAGMSWASAGARTLAVSLNILKVALPFVAIAAGIAIVENLADSINKSINPSKRLTDDLTGLKDALVQDNPNMFNRALEAVSQSATGASAPVSAFNTAILSAIEIQRRAEGALNNTNSSIDTQSFVLGKASRAWISQALTMQSDLKDIIDGKDFWETIFESGSGSTNHGKTLNPLVSSDSVVSRDELQKLVLGGVDVNELGNIAITSGKGAAMKVYKEFQKGYEKAHPGDESAANFGLLLKDRILPSVIDAYGEAATQAALSKTGIEDSGETAVVTADEFAQLNGALTKVNDSGQVVAVTFFGAKNALSELQGGLQGGIKGFVDFSAVLKSVQEDAKNAAKEAKNDSLEDSLVNVSTFGAKLEQANTKAETFYDGIKRLADGGRTSFATQLSALGPDAENILSESLDLSAEGQNKLEASARFAAFLASDAFSKALKANSVVFNEAYAQIFRATGSLDAVQDFIAKQLAGPEVAKQAEREWNINHPDFPLNITPELMNPSDEDLALWGDEVSGKLTVTATVDVNLDPNGRPRSTKGKTYTDTVTNASITLPASLDGAALTTSLDVWRANQNASPEQLAAMLNKDGLSASLDEWVRNHGPIDIRARVLPSLGTDRNGRPLNAGLFAGGGEVNMPHFASGGAWGQFKGPGSGTSDSILARVSNGEYINTADATNFWGPDFFDSLNRKMLPTNFLNLLGAAAVSGNRGPSHVAHVSISQINPLTRDPLKQLREDSEMVASGIWG